MKLAFLYTVNPPQRCTVYMYIMSCKVACLHFKRMATAITLLRDVDAVAFFPVVTRSKASVCGRSLAGISVWNSAGGGVWMFVCCECCVFSGGDFCDGSNLPPEESYRACVTEFYQVQEEPSTHKVSRIQWPDLNKFLRESWSFVNTLFNQLRAIKCNCRNCEENCGYFCGWKCNRNCIYFVQYSKK